VDFAAPTGTPVRAAADGLVVSAGWSGGYGKVIRLRHKRGFETLYGHLSKIDVKRGQRVEQGERIGAVGMTGLATGPHLDYRTIRAGAFVNPLTIQPQPAEPVPASARACWSPPLPRPSRRPWPLRRPWAASLRPPTARFALDAARPRP